MEEQIQTALNEEVARVSIKLTDMECALQVGYIYVDIPNGICNKNVLRRH